MSESGFAGWKDEQDLRQKDNSEILIRTVE
jgi:hypothetical protein